MNKVYRHRSKSQDEYLGRVSEDGRVFESRLEAEKYIGHVELDSGKIYISQNGEDKHLGRVEMDSGKIYLARFGPDEHLGQVHGNGKLYSHKWLASDEYLGHVEEMTSIAHGGAAFLLLIRPAMNEIKSRVRKAQTDRNEVDPGSAPAPAG